MRRSWRRAVLALAVPAFLAGCNIFSWTHDEGSSDDPATLLKDAEDALLTQDYDEALQYAQKGIDNDPGLGFPRLRYVAAQAVLGRADISIEDYLTVFTDESSLQKAGGSGAQLDAELLDMTLEELRALAEACPAAVAYLRELLDALEAGRIGAEDLLGIQFDVDLGFAISSLLTTFVTILDEDRNLDNGFTENPRITIMSGARGGYRLDYDCPDPTVPDCERVFVRCELVCPLWYRSAPERAADPRGASFCEALEGVYDAYRLAVGGDAPADIGCGETSLGPKPTPINEDFIIGQVLDFVYDGVERLFQDYVRSDGCSACASGGAR
ncbi:MAG: hypothetical protein JSW67_05425 [Candidatus Latescibacterota bacterium]|nr:MAG: hypothetical protein JSW67_05425 [Candidatus Latescibacterota bacterium]